MRGHDLPGPTLEPLRGPRGKIAIKLQVEMDIELEVNDARCRWCSEDR